MVVNLVYISILLDIIGRDICPKGGYIIFYREYSDSITVKIEDIRGKNSGRDIRKIVEFLEKESGIAYLRVFNEYIDISIGIYPESRDSREYIDNIDRSGSDWERVLKKRFLQVVGDS